MFPCVQSVQKIPLNVMTLKIQTDHVYTEQGVPISVKGVAQVKIFSEEQDRLQRASEIFSGMNIKKIEHICLETMEGHQRAIMGKNLSN